MGKVKKYFRLPLFVMILSILSVWLIIITKGEMPFLDQVTRDFVNIVSHSKLYVLARWITELGSRTFLISFTIMMGLFLWWLYNDWVPAFIFSSGTLFSHLLNVFIKTVVARERPRIYIAANAEGYSFPSGHAMISMVCYGLLMYFLQKRLSTQKSIILIQVIFSLLIFSIGISRYIINVHYLTDVLFGFALGYVLLISFIFGYKWIEGRNKF